MKAKSFLPSTIVISILLSQLTFAALPRYEIIDLGLGIAYGINEAGQVVGSYWSPTGELAFMWDKSTGMMELGTLGGPWSWASAINDAAQVVGCSRTLGGQNHAFFWDKTNGMIDLGTLSGRFHSRAFDINNAGQVVGGSAFTCNSRAFIWDSIKGMRDLGTLGGYYSEAFAINDAGLVVGWADTPTSSHAFIWNKTERMIDLGTLGNCFWSEAHGINSCGQIVGISDYHVFLWEDGEMIDLGTLEQFSEDCSINDAGQVVGAAEYEEGKYYAFYWDTELGMIRLDELLPAGSGWRTLCRAKDINNRGQIVGQGITNSGKTLAFLMTPVPPKIIYADDDAAGANDGSSWADAFNYLQDALAAAWGGDEIHVAEGIYTPDSNSAYPNGSGDREATFQLINGVNLKGGYAGAGSPDPNARDIELYETILSGDLAGDDEPNFTHNSENSYHVVTGSGTDETAVLDGCIVTAGNANGPYANGIDYSDGGGMYNDNGCPTLTNCTFRFNAASNLSHGGAMANKYSKPTLTGCIFTGNQAEIGGAMYNYVTQATLTDCTFIENSAQRGGAIVSGGYLELINCNFIRNSAGYDGGAINATAMTLNNCLFSENTADYGGAIGVADRSYATLTDCTFSSNSADKGGAIWMFDAGEGATLTNCTFTENSAYMGGGIHNSSYSSPTLIDCTFTANSAEDGGGMYNAKSNPTLIHCTFSGNSAGPYGGGGGMYNHMESHPALTNCTFTGNSAPWGGGMASYGSNATFINCTFKNNKSIDDDHGGGAVFNEKSSSMLINCNFISNEAEGCGGGMWNNNGGNPLLVNCTFSGNNSDGGGAGGGICNMLNSSPTLINCTLSGNNDVGCDWGSGGMFNWDGCVPKLVNCIFWANRYFGVEDECAQIDGGVPFINYCCIQGWTGSLGGTGNIDNDPCFSSPGYWNTNDTPDYIWDDFWVDGDYHLFPDSPCIDAGDPNYIAGPNETDLDGKPRVIGGRVDMGAYEAPIPAEARILPRTINLASKGKFVTCYIWLPDDYDVADIESGSVLIEQQIKAEQFSVDQQKQVATAKFDREKVQSILNVGDIKLAITGQLTDGTIFEGMDIIKVTDKTGKKSAKRR